MDIRQFRVVVKARDFDRTCKFYGETLSLPRLTTWDRENGRGALYQAGTGAIEVRGHAHGGEVEGLDEAFDYQGPKHKLEVVLLVPSAEQAYEELLFREKNIPGGLRSDPDGALVFETHDPDGVKIILRQPT
ncbi:MAG: VOC family protein [Acidobacteria bacterium]|nr:VOC family protein [Acidobacteriota bacterium]